MPLDHPFKTPPEPTTLAPVAPGVSWLRMPLPFALDHINLWLLDDGDAHVIVDTGFGDSATREAWRTALAADGRSTSALIVTHYHPDHLGQAATLAREAGDVPVFMTQGEALAARAQWHQLAGHGVDDMLALFRAHGLDEERLTALEQRGNTYRRGIPELPAHFRRIFDGDVLRIGETEWRVITGHGHSPEHASLYCEEHAVLIAGDMLLPRISPNISVSLTSPDDDTLQWFLSSLQRIKNLPDDTLVLPSHGLPFRGIEDRVEQLEAHHAERCSALIAALDTPASAADLLAVLFPRKLDNHQLMFAMGEAIAHLNHLLARGDIRRLADEAGSIRYLRTV